MKTINKILSAVAFGVGLFLTGSAQAQTATVRPVNNPEVTVQLNSFVTQKVAQADAAAKADGKGMPPEYRGLFAAAEKGDWLTVSNLFLSIGRHNGALEGPGPVDTAFRGSRFEAVKEIWGAFTEVNAGNEKYSVMFGKGIIESVPPGSIYFGGTDEGRFIITALQKSQVDGDPFFTLTQNALADGSYLDYLRSMYGEEIYVPTADDWQKCFKDYTEDAARRRQNHQLKPGEDVEVDAASGRVQVNGQVALMEINGLLAKVIFEKNTNHEFFVEESYPLDWMYPHLEPHGLIMKINRQPLPELSDEIVRHDNDDWEQYVTPMIGDWLNNDTSVKEVADFAEKVFVEKDLSGFKGDPQFVQNEHSCRMFSKLRSAIAGLYAWRAQHVTRAGEKERMNDAADFAFRQAWALCPYSPEAVFRYVNLLLSENRAADALRVAATAGNMPALQGSNGEQMRGLITQLKQYQKAK